MQSEESYPKIRRPYQAGDFSDILLRGGENTARQIERSGNAIASGTRESAKILADSMIGAVEGYQAARGRSQQAQLNEQRKILEAKQALKADQDIERGKMAMEQAKLQEAYAKGAFDEASFGGKKPAWFKPGMTNQEVEARLGQQKQIDDVTFGAEEAAANLALKKAQTEKTRAETEKERKGGGAAVGKPYDYVDSKGNKRLGTYYPGIGLIQKPDDQIVAPFTPTEGQSKQANLVESGKLANTQYENAILEGKNTGNYDPTNPVEFVDNSQWAPKWLKSKEAGAADAAQAAWVESYLRDVSGAAIPESERLSYADDFFPRPGDSDKILANKKVLRDQKEANARRAAGNAAPPETDDPRVLSFMKKNNIKDPDEAIKILKENGKL